MKKRYPRVRQFMGQPQLGALLWYDTTNCGWDYSTEKVVRVSKQHEYIPCIILDSISLDQQHFNVLVVCNGKIFSAWQKSLFKISSCGNSIR